MSREDGAEPMNEERDNGPTRSNRTSLVQRFSDTKGKIAGTTNPMYENSDEEVEEAED